MCIVDKQREARDSEVGKGHSEAGNKKLDKKEETDRTLASNPIQQEDFPKKQIFRFVGNATRIPEPNIWIKFIFFGFWNQRMSAQTFYEVAWEIKRRASMVRCQLAVQIMSF